MDCSVRKLVSASLLYLYALSAAGICRAGSDSFVLVGHPGANRNVPVVSLFDFGQVDPIETPKLDHVFVIRNVGKTPIVIDRLYSSCPCTTARIWEPEAPLPVSVGPGAQTTIKVNINMEGQGGPQLKFIKVFADQNPVPLAGLELSASVLDTVTAMPAALDFGEVPLGETRSQTLTIKVDPRLMEPGQAPTLVSLNPFVHVVYSTTVGSDTFTYVVGLSGKSPPVSLEGALTFAAGSVRSGARILVPTLGLVRARSN